MTSRIASFAFLALASLVCSSVVWGQGPPDPPKPEISAADQARLHYYIGIKEYIFRYAQTPASCSEIVEAALSTYDEEGRKLLRLVPGFNYVDSKNIDELAEVFRKTTERWAMKIALEAKYPDPSIFKAPPPAPAAAPAQPPGARSPKKKSGTSS